MGSTPTFDLYIDDSGSRLPDRPSKDDRRDGLDAFALGGVLIKAEEAPQLFDLVEGLRSSLGLTYPLHSHKIRSRAQEFSWLGADKERASKLYGGIEHIVRTMPGWVTACVVHRPGYNERYKALYGDKRWELCRTAYQILLERCAKFAAVYGRRLKVFAEATGRAEDRSLRDYQKTLLAQGAEFDTLQSAKYSPMASDEMSKTVIKNIDFIRKEQPFAQAADLVLYPLIKGRYQPSYPPFRMLCEVRKVIDYALPDGLGQCGVKYSCFDGPGFAEPLFQEDKRPSLS